MKTNMVQTAAIRVIKTEEAIRRLCFAVLVAWGLVAGAVLASDVSGGWTLWLIGPFALFGTGLGLMVLGFWSTEMAYRLTVIAGGGLAGVTVISQLLMLTGAFSSVAVVGVETGVIALLWIIWERTIWVTRS